MTKFGSEVMKGRDMIAKG